MAEKRRDYIGTDFGLMIMTDDGSGWVNYSDVLNGKFVRAMTRARAAAKRAS